MKKSTIEDLIWGIGRAHTPFDSEALVAAFKKAEKTELELSEHDIDSPGLLREQYEMSMEMSGYYLYDMWDSKSLPENSYNCIFDYDIIHDEFKRQFSIERDRVKEYLADYMDEFPEDISFIWTFDFDECFVRFLDSDRFDMSIIFSSRLAKWYDVKDYLFDDDDDDDVCDEEEEEEFDEEESLSEEEKRLHRFVEFAILEKIESCTDRHFLNELGVVDVRYSYFNETPSLSIKIDSSLNYGIMEISFNQDNTYNLSMFDMWNTLVMEIRRAPCSSLGFMINDCICTNRLLDNQKERPINSLFC